MNRNSHRGHTIAGEDREGLLRVARYGARAPVAEGRLRYDAERAEVELVSDARDGPYVGVHRLSALEFVARWVDHVPERYETRVRYYGAYATRRRVWWRRRGIELAPMGEGAPALAESGGWPALKARRRRWAELLRRVFQVEVEVCPRCGGPIRNRPRRVGGACLSWDSQPVPSTSSPPAGPPVGGADRDFRGRNNLFARTLAALLLAARNHELGQRLVEIRMHGWVRTHIAPRRQNRQNGHRRIIIVPPSGLSHQPLPKASTYRRRSA